MFAAVTISHLITSWHMSITHFEFCEIYSMHYQRTSENDHQMFCRRPQLGIHRNPAYLQYHCASPAEQYRVRHKRLWLRGSA